MATTRQENKLFASSYSTNLILIVVCTLFLYGNAAGQVIAKCKDSIKISYLGTQKLTISEREFVFGAFRLQNTSSRPLKLMLAPVGPYIILYPRAFDLQARSGSMDWQLTDIVLQELQPAPASLSISTNAVVDFLVNSGSFSHTESASRQEFRLLLNDASGCSYRSKGFKIGEH